MKSGIKQFAEINSRSNADTLNSLNRTFNLLDSLNQILYQTIPLNLHNACHIGAVNMDEATVVLFATNQQAFHLIKNFSDLILHTFNQHNFNFQKIIIKIRISYPNNNIISPKKLDQKSKNQLKKLANALGKPELIKPNLPVSINLEDEIDLN
jgi:hypothetical protein